MKKTKLEVIEYINDLKSYEGYVQFSHRAIDLKKDIFPKVEDIDVDDIQNGFVYEAHFCKENQSIMIRQINDAWVVSVTDISDAKMETFHGISDLMIKMAQIWELKKDEPCKGMEMLKLKKVVFAGFKKDKK
jgi:CRISPR type III-associated protein (TIGR04423 family)